MTAADNKGAAETKTAATPAKGEKTSDGKIIRVPQHSVVLVRDGKHVRPPIGKAYGFTKEEVESINAANPNALRKPVNESADAIAEEAAASARDAASADADATGTAAKNAAAGKGRGRSNAADDI